METKKYKQETAKIPILTWGEGGRGGEEGEGGGGGGGGGGPELSNEPCGTQVVKTQQDNF